MPNHGPARLRPSRLGTAVKGLDPPGTAWGVDVVYDSIRRPGQEGWISISCRTGEKLAARRSKAKEGLNAPVQACRVVRSLGLPRSGSHARGIRRRTATATADNHIAA